MAVSNTTIKAISKNILKSNHIGNIVAATTVLAVYFICNNIAAIFSVIAGEIFASILFYIMCFFLLSPVAMGLVRYFWRLSCNTKDNPITVFYYFSSKSAYFKVLRLAFSLLVRIVFCYVIFSIPVYVLRLITGSWLYSVLNVSIPIWTVNLSNLINFLRLIAFTATLFSVLKYYLAPMLFVADENMDTAEAIHLSSVISKRSLLDFIFLAFSFSGWILLSMLILPSIFTLPYIITAYLIHSSYAVTAFNEETAKISHDDIPTFIAGV